MTDTKSQQLNAFKFHIEWAGASFGFNEALGLGTSNSNALRSQQQPSLTLSRGVFLGTPGFKSWLDIVSADAHDLTIYLHDDHHQIVASWVAKEATLVNHIAAFNSDGATVAIESLQVQHAGLKLVNA